MCIWIELTWDQPAPEVEAYGLYYQEHGTMDWLLPTFADSTTATSYQFNGLSPATEYDFRIVPMRDGGGDRQEATNGAELTHTSPGRRPAPSAATAPAARIGDCGSPSACSDFLFEDSEKALGSNAALVGHDAYWGAGRPERLLGTRDLGTNHHFPRCSVEESPEESLEGTWRRTKAVGNLLDRCTAACRLLDPRPGDSKRSVALRQSVSRLTS